MTTTPPWFASSTRGLPRRIAGARTLANCSIVFCASRTSPDTLILMGADRTSARYIGAMNKEWKPVDSVEIPGGGDSLPLLRRLQKF